MIRWTAPRVAAVAVLLLVGGSAVIGYTANVDVPASYLGRATVVVTPPARPATSTPTMRASAAPSSSPTPGSTSAPASVTATPTPTPISADASVTPLAATARPAVAAASPPAGGASPQRVTPSPASAATPVAVRTMALAGGHTAVPTATDTPVPATPSPTAVAALVFGHRSAGTATDSSDYAYLNGSDATLASSGTLRRLSVYVGATAPGAHVRLALYGADALGAPGTLLVATGEAVAATGWNTLATPPFALSPGTYWIVAQTDSPATVYGYAALQPAPGRCAWTPGAYGPFPASAGPWVSQAACSFAMYGTVTVP